MGGIGAVWLRFCLLLVGGAGLWWLLPIDLVGYFFSYVVRAAVALLVAVALWLWSSPEARPRRNAALMALAPVALLSYLNFGTFHGVRTHVQLHDMAHYYLGAKYAPELGRSDLYIAMLRAQRESSPRRVPARVRDLETYATIPASRALHASGPVREQFTRRRWQSFRQDVAVFESRLGRLFPRVLVDHGFNASPVWLLFGYPLAQLVPEGAYSALQWAACLDGVLVGLTLLLVGRSFGKACALLALLAYTLTFGADYGWTGGSFLRSLWWCSLVAALCALRSSRYLLAGSLFALASGLRVFPALLLVPLLARAGYLLLRNKRLPRRYVKMLQGAALAALALGLLTGCLPRGFGDWQDFIATMRVHSTSLSATRVGLLELTGYHGFDTRLSLSQRTTLIEWRTCIQWVQRVLVVAATTAWVVRWGVKRRDLELLACGGLVVFCSVSLAAYYYALVVVFVVGQPGPRLALLFLSQAIALAASRWEPRPILPYVYQSALLLVVLASAFLPSRIWLRRAPSSARVSREI